MNELDNGRCRAAKVMTMNIVVLFSLMSSYAQSLQ